jgi:hypothetical protein
MDSFTEDGAVVSVHWNLEAIRPSSTEGERDYRTGSYGTVGFTANPKSKKFISYDDLTEEICVKWVLDYYGPQQVARMQLSQSSVLDEQQTPTKFSGTPWGRAIQEMDEQEEATKNDSSSAESTEEEDGILE